MTDKEFDGYTLQRYSAEFFSHDAFSARMALIMDAAGGEPAPVPEADGLTPIQVLNYLRSMYINFSDVFAARGVLAMEKIAEGLARIACQ